MPVELRRRWEGRCGRVGCPRRSGVVGARGNQRGDVFDGVELAECRGRARACGVERLHDLVELATRRVAVQGGETVGVGRRDDVAVFVVAGRDRVAEHVGLVGWAVRPVVR